MNTIEKKIDAKLILSIIAAGIMSFSGVVVETAMNVTFPTLMKEFNIDTSTVQWITTGYLLVLACIIPASSYLKKRFTTKSLFVTAICLFIIGTVMAAAAPVFSLLLAGRLIQGIGTGIALPLMFNIVLEQVPEERLGLMMGIASLITAMAPAVGPSVVSTIVASAQAASSDMAAATREGSSYAFYLLAGLSVVMILCSVGAFVSARQKHRRTSGCAQTQ